MNNCLDSKICTGLKGHASEICSPGRRVTETLSEPLADFVPAIGNQIYICGSDRTDGVKNCIVPNINLPPSYDVFPIKFLNDLYFKKNFVNPDTSVVNEETIKSRKLSDFSGTYLNIFY